MDSVNYLFKTLGVWMFVLGFVNCLLFGLCTNDLVIKAISAGSIMIAGAALMLLPVNE